MDFLWDAITVWLKDILVSGIMSNLSGMFDSVNEKVGDIATQVGSTPQAWNASIFNMVQTLSQNVVLPVAGVILAFVMTLELVQILMDKNNFHDIETAVFFRWIFKTACAILIVTNTWNKTGRPHLCPLLYGLAREGASLLRIYPEPTACLYPYILPICADVLPGSA